MSYRRAKREKERRFVICVQTIYVKVSGVWKYLYRAIDRDGNLVDVRLSEHRDMDGTKAFCHQAVKTAGHTPEHVTTDGHDSYPRATEKRWARTSFTVPTRISTIGSTKITAASNSAIIPCADSGTSAQLRASVGPWISSANSSVCVPTCVIISRSTTGILCPWATLMGELMTA